MRFHPIVQQWFTSTLGQPTAAQRDGWASILDRRHTLIAAPTGSGKTLAAFLAALDRADTRSTGGRPPGRSAGALHLAAQGAEQRHSQNLAEPRAGIAALAPRAGPDAAPNHVGGSHRRHAASERAAMLRTPPHILVTTPESLYLLLTSDKQPPDAANGADGDRRRDPRPRRRRARRASRAVARTPPPRCGAAAPAHRTVGDAKADRRGRAVSCRHRSRRGARLRDRRHRASPRHWTSAIEVPGSALEAVWRTKSGTNITSGWQR